jgi:tetratricopeptide (TPR) repeat protein
MKKYLSIIYFLLFNSFLGLTQTNFNAGFENGYKKGYCQNKGVGCLSPIPPIAPTPNVGENSNSYQDGYNRGFESGLYAQLGNNANQIQRYKTSAAEPIEYIRKININDIYALARVLREAKEKAIELQENGDHQASIRISEAALKVSPKDAEFMMLCATSYLELESYSQGLMYLKMVTKYDSNRENVKVVKEVIHEIEDGTYQQQREQEKSELIKASDDSNKHTSSNDNSLYNQMSKLLNDKNYIKALEISNILVDRNKTWQAYSFRAGIQFRLGNYSESIADYSKSINLNPSVESYFYRAISKNNLKDYYGAINDYDKIIELNKAPDNYDLGSILNDKAFNLLNLGKLDQALVNVNKALELNKGKWYIWDTRGELYFKTGAYIKSIEDMTTAISIQPHASSYFYRGLSKIKTGDKDGGCKDLSKSGELGNEKAYIEIKTYCN